MTPRRIRKARQAQTRTAVVIQSPVRLTAEAVHQIRRHAHHAWPGRPIVVLDGGMTAVTM